MESWRKQSSSTPSSSRPSTATVSLRTESLAEHLGRQMDEEQRDRLRALDEQKAALLAKLPQTPRDTADIESSSSLKKDVAEINGSTSAREGKEEDGGKYDYHSDIILSNDDGDDRPDIYTHNNSKTTVPNNIHTSVPVVVNNAPTVFSITVLESLPLDHSSTTGSDGDAGVDAPTVYEVIEADY